MKLSLGQTIGMNYPKYVTLNKANQIFKNSEYADASRLNIYIDGTQIISSIYNSNVIIDNKLGIISGLINLCALLRDYYRKSFGCESRIFIVISECECTHNRSLYPDYYKNLYDKYTTENMDFVYRNINLLKELCKYLDDIYLVLTRFEPIVKIYDIIQKEAQRKVPNIILSKDPYTFQIPAIDNTVMVFKLNKGENENITVCTHSNCIEKYLLATRKDVTKDIKNIHPEHLSLLMTLTNVPTRNIKTLKSVNVAISMLSELESFTGIEDFYDNAPINLTKAISRTAFLNRWKCIDLAFQYMLYQRSPEAEDKSYRINLSDPDAVREINNKYFISNPLDLNRL